MNKNFGADIMFLCVAMIIVLGIVVITSKSGKTDTLKQDNTVQQ